MKFDGKQFAKEIESEVAAQTVGKSIKIASVLVGNDPASELYTKLKMQAAERVAIRFEVIRIKENSRAEEVIRRIQELASRTDITGIMVQLPIPGIDRKHQNEIVKNIPIDKDIDGLRWEESGMMPATVRAVLSVLEKIAQSQISNSQILKLGKCVVVGSKGSVGRPLVHFLRTDGYVSVDAFDREETDPARRLLAGEVVISCVGKPGLIDREDIRPGSVVVDVGITQVAGRVAGDMTKEAYNVASVSVEVPGGIGPVTIACLMANAAEMHGSQRRAQTTISAS